jgi:cytochrome c oxidase subunit 2
VGLKLPKRLRTAALVALLVPTLLFLSACSEQDKQTWKRGAIPEGASNHSQGITELWQWTWVAALATGVLVWGLIFFVVIKFRRRSDDEIPVQTRYNLPMEILYTIAPVVMVLVFFHFVINTQNAVNAEVKNPDHVVKVVGQQWSWTFNYVDDSALGGSGDVANCQGTDAQTCVFEPGTPAHIPTLVLPVGESVRFELSSPDVIHSFWVPAFTYKMDVVPGRDNYFNLTPEREGTFAGKCTELCGTYHSRMLFNVRVVSADEFKAELERLRAEGNTGLALGGSDATTQAGLEPNEEGSQ